MTYSFILFKEKARRLFAKIPPRFWAFLCMFSLGAVSILALTAPLNLILVTDEHEGKALVYHYSGSQQQISASLGMDSDGPELHNYRHGHGMELSTLYVDYSFPVSIEYDGEEYSAYMHDGTVANLLTNAGVTLGEEDFVEPSLFTPLETDLTAQVYRVTYEDEVEIGIIPHETVVRANSLLNTWPDRTEILIEGHDGYGETHYRHKYINGELQYTVLLNSTIEEEPVTEVQLKYAPEPISSIESHPGITITDGVPSSYTSVISGVAATGYYSARGRGSSGLGLYYGTCAVNPNVIPYGTLMYISSATGDSFEYGYAIATDTGTAMMEGHVGVDLFYETFRESQLNGRRTVNIYIIG